MEVTRYITVPAGRPTIVDVDTGKPLPVQDCTYNTILRYLTRCGELAKSMDVLDRMELRTALTSTKDDEGGVVELTEAQHRELVATIRRKPCVLGDVLVFSPDVAAFLRAIVKAPAEDPRVAT